MPRSARRRSPPPDTRRRLLAAAAVEFGAHGFTATTMDRVAARAGVNKAMIYYHFPDKRALYTAIIRDAFSPIVERLRAAVAPGDPPDVQLNRLIEALVRSVDRSSHFLPLFLREIADGGAHLGRAELGLLAALFGIVSSLIAEGVRQQAFSPVHAALAHFTLVAPLVMFRAAAPVRARIKKLQKVEIPDAEADAIIAHLQMVAGRMLMRPPRDQERQP